MRFLPTFCVFLFLAVISDTVCAGDNWPQFRGPSGDGRTDAVGLPLTWSETENIKWKTPIHGRAWSSPVVWGEQIWMTAAPEDGKRLFAVCIDLATGKIIHDIKVFDVPDPGKKHSLNSFASPTPVLEAGRVYVHFGTLGTACLDSATGKTIWSRRDLNCDHMNGPGGSPIIFEDLLIFHLDGIDVQFVVALDKATGRTVWKTDRSTDFGELADELRKAYCTPLIIRHDGKPQMLSLGAEALISYDPRSGRELWKARFSGFSNTARPVHADGVAYMCSGFMKRQMLAVGVDGRGDVTDSHILWTKGKNMPVKPSPILFEGCIFTVDDSGVAMCSDAKTGKSVWRKRLGGSFSASPVLAEGRLYFFSHDGPATVIEAGRNFKQLAKNTLDAGFMASPAVVGKAMILRTKTHLYRVEKE
jgi:outer membrane protein assembly factor BamB